MQPKRCEAGMPDGRRCPNAATIDNGTLLACDKHVRKGVHFRLAAQRRFGPPKLPPDRPKRAPADYQLPCGIWKTRAGEAVLYNRYRQPIFTRRLDGTVAPERPTRRVEGITDTLHLWPNKGCNASAFDRCRGILQRWSKAAHSGEPASLKELLGNG